MDAGFAFNELSMKKKLFTCRHLTRLEKFNQLDAPI